MNQHTNVEVNTHQNGIVRVYGNGGLLFEVQGKYVVLKTFIDPALQIPSGTVAKNKESC